jgi:hypothetical protein
MKAVSRGVTSGGDRSEVVTIYNSEWNGGPEDKRCTLQSRSKTVAPGLASPARKPSFEEDEF